MTLFGIVTVVLITLKLVDYITWSWWWVLLPLYGPPAFVVSCALFVIMCAGVAHLCHRD